MFFTATTPATGAEIWVTDGTELGTKEVYDFRSGPTGTVARPLFSNDDVLLVNHYSPIAGSELHYLSRSHRCPTDPVKTAPGACGTPDTDNDGDGALDCVDRCLQDPSEVAPGFCGCGVPDPSTGRESPLACQTADFCLSDPAKREPGVCGYGVSEVDTNSNRQPTCIVNVALRVKLDQVIAQVRARRLPRDGRLSGGALRKVRARFALRLLLCRMCSANYVQRLKIFLLLPGRLQKSHSVILNGVFVSSGKASPGRTVRFYCGR